jgi:nucleoside 2-deoxyribosyltransferase
MKVYLSGGLRIKGDNELLDTWYIDDKPWRTVAKEALNERGHTVFDPKKKPKGWTFDAIEIVSMDLLALSESDLVLAEVMNALHFYVGTFMEMVYAKIMNKPVILVTNLFKLSPWIKYHSTAIFSDLNDAIEYIGDAYDKGYFTVR